MIYARIAALKNAAILTVIIYSLILILNYAIIVINTA